MKARATRNRRGRRYVGPTCLVTGDPANLAMVDRWMRKGRRQLARKDRLEPRRFLPDTAAGMRCALREEGPRPIEHWPPAPPGFFWIRQQS